MIDENCQTNEKETQKFGDRLKFAREELRLEVKDVASQLRLRESIIEMLEREMYSDDIPLTFLRGYLRSYAKFLDLPEKDLATALEPLKPKPKQQYIEPIEPKQDKISFFEKFITYIDAAFWTFFDKNTLVLVVKYTKKYSMQIFTTLVAITLLSLVYGWWHGHKNQVVVPTPVASQPQLSEPAAAEPSVTDNTTLDETLNNASEPVLPTLAEESAFEGITPSDAQSKDSPQRQSANENAKQPTKKLSSSTKHHKKKVIDIYND